MSVYSRPSRLVSLCSAVLLIALQGLEGADARLFGVAKGELLVQADSGAPAPTGGAPFVLNAFAESDLPGAFLGGRLTLPIGASLPLMLGSGGSELGFQDAFATLNQLNTAYPEGSYTIRMDTAHDGSRSVVLACPASSLPNDPHFANYAEAQVIDPAEDFVLAWDAMTGGTVADFVQVSIENANGDEVFSSPGPLRPGALNGLATGVPIPAGRLPPGQTFSARLTIARLSVVNADAYPGATGVVAFMKETTAIFHSIRSPDILRYGLRRSAEHRQTGEGPADLLAGNPYSFSAGVEGTGPGLVTGGSVRWPSGAVQVLPGDPDGTGYYLYSRYPSLSALEAGSPSGTYTFSIATAHEGAKSFSLTLPAPAFAAAPHLVNFNAGQAVNPGGDFTLIWDPFIGGRVEDFVAVEITDSVSGDTMLAAEPGTPSALNGLVTQFTIPAGLLSPNHAYEVRIEFWKMNTIDALSYPGGIGYVLHASQTRLELRTGASIPVPSLGTTVLPAGLIGTSYSFWLKSIAGSPPFTFALAPGSNPLPTGLALAGNGVVSGTPTAAGTTSVQIRITDAAQTVGYSDVSLTIAASPPAQPPAISVTPSTIRADDAGFIDLVITGLVPGQRIRLDRHVDLNGNGVLDLEENFTLVQRIMLTDGQARFYAGVRDPNVPGDEDGQANGEIRCRLSILMLSEFGRAARPYLFTVTGESAGIAPTSARFSITQPDAAQTISGVVRVGGSPASAYVALLKEEGHGIVAAVDTAADGSFSLKASPGDYVLMAIGASNLANFSASPRIRVVAGQNLTQNLTMIIPTRQISGRVLESGSDAPLPALQVAAENDRGEFAFTLTDSAGNFVLPVSAGAWEIQPSQGEVTALGRIPQSLALDTTQGSLSNITVRLRGANALVYGALRTSEGVPVPATLVQAEDQTGLFDSPEVFTDANGNFALGVVANMTWSIGVESEDLPPIGFLESRGSATPARGQAVVVDLTVVLPTAHVRGRVVDSQGAGVASVRMGASRDGGTQTSALTDPSGQFDLGLRAGHWYVNLWSDELNTQGLVWPQMEFEVTDGVDRNGILYIVRQATASIHGVLHDNFGNPLADQWVSASQVFSGTNYSVGQRTALDGSFTIRVFDGVWQVNPDCWNLQDLGYDCPDPALITMAGADGQVELVARATELRLFSAVVPTGVVGQYYSAPIVFVGNATSWSVAAGSLPQGLSLESDGRLTGTPAASGLFRFSILLQGVGGQSDQREISMTVNQSGFMLPCLTLLPGLPTDPFRIRFTGLIPGRFYRVEGGSVVGLWNATANEFTATSDSLDFSYSPPSVGRTFYYRLRVE